MQIRKPAVAGQFYSGSRDGCLGEIKECIKAAAIGTTLPETIAAAIVPHAGWTFSGDLAAMVFSAAKQVHERIDTFVIFGAAHSYMNPIAAVYDHGSWSTPLGEIAIDEELAGDIIKAAASAEAETAAHKFEHSIEVQVPFIQHLFPEARIVPIVVPPATFAVELGAVVGGLIAKIPDKKVVCIGSTDLTHYGPRYGFCPQGTGAGAIDWAKDVNDRGFIDLAVEMKATEVLAGAVEKQNACGPGSAAAAIAAAKALGKTKGTLLAHTHSNEVMERKFNQTSEESGGYAAIVF